MKNNVNKIYGKRLKELRYKKNFTQEFIANSIDVRTATISDFENGKITIKLDVLAAICNIIGITLKEFFSFDADDLDLDKNELIAEINSHLKFLDKEKLQYIKTMAVMYSKD